MKVSPELCARPLDGLQGEARVFGFFEAGTCKLAVHMRELKDSHPLGPHAIPDTCLLAVTN